MTLKIISVSDCATLAVFEVYAKFEAGTGAKLNLSKCEGLWLGAWRNRLDSPVAISWNSVKIKSLGVFIGYGNLDDANWHPRIDAVERCLNSWRSRPLLVNGKALVINALVLSRIWYIASLIYMPTWVCRKLNKIIFNFFGKHDLVACNVLVQCPDLRGFSVVSIQLKVYSLSTLSLSQWVKRLVVCPNGWTFLLKYWLLDHFNTTPFQVRSSIVDFDGATSLAILLTNVRTKSATIVIKSVMSLRTARKTFLAAYANVLHTLPVPVNSPGSLNFLVLHVFIGAPLKRRLLRLALMLVSRRIIPFISSQLLWTILHLIPLHLNCWRNLLNLKPEF